MHGNAQKINERSRANLTPDALGGAVLEEQKTGQGVLGGGPRDRWWCRSRNTESKLHRPLAGELAVLALMLAVVMAIAISRYRVTLD